MRRIIFIVAVFLAAMSYFVGTASAHVQDSPTPTCPSGYTFNPNTAKCDKTPPPSQQCVTASNGITYCNQTSTVTSSESDKKVETLNVATSGVLQVRWAFPNGWRPQSLKGCRWVRGGTNSYYDRFGRLIKVSWKGKLAYVCPDSSSPSGYRKAGGPPTWKDCGNIFWPPFIKQPKQLFRGAYRVVKNFTYTAKLTLKLTLNGSASASARCTAGDASNGSSASANASGTDVESIVVTGTGSGSSMAQAIGQAHNVAINSQQANNLKATVTATATYRMQLKASVFCQASPPPTPTPPTPSQAHAYLSKVAYVNGSAVTLNGGEFTFSQTVNGATTGTTTNAATNQSRDLGTFNAGTTVQECETNAGGYTPDQVCITHTMAAGETYTFQFINRKTVTTSQPSCDSLAVSATTIQAGQSLTATTSLTANGSTLQSVLYNWGDGSTNYNGTSMSHTYSTAGTYTITATGNYNLPNGSPVSVTSAACQKQVTVSQAPPSTAPISIGKVCEDASHNQIACPTGTFTFAVSGGSVSSVTLNSNPQSAGTCTIGGSVTITENQVNGWTILSANPQTFSCTSAGINAVFKNAELATSPPAASLNFIQDIHASNYSTTPATTYTMPTCGFVQTNVGDVLVITFQAGYGNYGQPGNSTTTYNATADGTNQSFCPTYTSPTESGIQDQVMMTVLDKTTGYSVTTYSNVFNILAPGNP